MAKALNRIPLDIEDGINRGFYGSPLVDVEVEELDDEEQLSLVNGRRNPTPLVESFTWRAYVATTTTHRHDIVITNARMPFVFFIVKVGDN